ncbi:MAG: UDP-4-amino-4,6-dideoxy-N-acetyl-beta-L-altrosamine transaminase [bacterium]|nr:UDP-4-amino-4,6-dideoxy-N-acetyl-beta-L-altrosamine transaminase [bacterium]MCM1374904.1 UDP-4-amino-4,6-dideoxy-N-acetyl-beta-L-altrosamine transaminase [Muribaculum sp.]
MEKPAICGGIPVRTTALSYGRQYIDDADIQAVTETLRSDYLTCGPRIVELEKKLCAVTGAKYCVAVSNGTAALHIAALAAGIGPEDEVITTPITFAASANCALYCGARPIFADINPDTYNIDPASIRAHITPHTRAVVAVDFTGQAVEHDEIRAICQEHHLTLIEDAAHSIGTRYKGRPVGSIADMTTFSFHPVKTVTAGEGGAVTTDNRELYDRLVLLRSHGITRDRGQMAHPTDAPWYNEQVGYGYNYRMTELQAALLISQLDKLGAFSARRKEITARYDAAFSQLPQLQVQREIPESDTTRHLYILRLRSNMLSCTRRQFFDALAAEGIQSQVHYLPVYWHSYYEKLGYERGLCPEAERYYEEVMSLPLYYSLTDQDVDDVIHIVQKLVTYYAR